MIQFPFFTCLIPSKNEITKALSEIKDGGEEDSTKETE